MTALGVDLNPAPPPRMLVAAASGGELNAWTRLHRRELPGYEVDRLEGLADFTDGCSVLVVLTGWRTTASPEDLGDVLRAGVVSGAHLVASAVEGGSLRIPAASEVATC